MKPRSVDIAFTKTVAEFYQRALVPLLFEPYAADLARRALQLGPSTVLEVGCGTGVVTRALAKALPSACEVTASDLNNGMIDHAQEIGTARTVAWFQADVVDLPCADSSYDLVICQFAIMFFPDRVSAYREIRRTLRPGGTFLFNVWSSIESNELAQVAATALAQLYPDNPPAFLSRTPYGKSDTHQLEADLLAAGFSAIEFEQREETGPLPDPAMAAVAYCHGTPLRSEILERDPDGLERATSAVENAIRQRWGDGPSETKLSAVVVQAKSD